MRKYLMLLVLASLPLWGNPAWGQAPSVGVHTRQKNPNHAIRSGNFAQDRGSTENPLVVDTTGHHQTPNEVAEAQMQAAGAQTNEQHHQSMDRWMLRWSGVTALATAGLILIGLGGVFAALLTLRAIKGQVDAQICAERAWIFGELRWFDEHPKHYSHGTSYAKGEEAVERTNALVKLICKNDGRSPAWIDSIRACAEIAQDKRSLANDPRFQSYGILPPMGVGKDGFTALDLECTGMLDEPNKTLYIWVLIDYHDAFGTHGTTSLGYGIAQWGLLFRQDGMPERNWNK